MMTTRLMLAALTLCALSLAPPASADDQTALCDQLAASPVDTMRPATAAGVPYGEIEVANAEAACRAAWDTNGLPRMGYQLARVLDQAGRQEEALTLYQAAAAGGYVEAKLGIGHSLSQIAHARVVELNKQAAKAGSVNALYNLGVFARDDDQDVQQALVLFGEAAALGDAEAAYNIAVLYDEGEMLLRNTALATQFYEQAVAGNFSFARINLGYLLLEDPVEPQEWQRALTLFRAAAEDDGDINAGLQLALMLQNGNAADQDESEALVIQALQARDFELARFLQQADTGLSERNLGAIISELDTDSIDGARTTLPAYYAIEQ